MEEQGEDFQWIDHFINENPNVPAVDITRLVSFLKGVRYRARINQEGLIVPQPFGDWINSLVFGNPDMHAKVTNTLSIMAYVQHASYFIGSDYRFLNGVNFTNFRDQPN